nr:hypothetical protein [Tanacetum cinerariifolium]
FPLNYEPEPGYTQNYNSCPHDSPSFPQQYPCCDDCGVTHEPYQCQPKNHNYYDEEIFCYDSNSFGIDHCQPPKYTVIHTIFNAHNNFLNSQNELFTSQNKIMEQMTQLTSICEMACQIVQKKLEEKQIEEEQAAKAQNQKLTPSEPIDSLSMGDEHLDTILVTESDEFIKSCVENLVPNPSESEGENGCDVPSCFTTFSNILFDDEYEFDSVDDQSLHNEDFSEKIFSNPLFEEEIISIKKNQHHLNAESDIVESMLNLTPTEPIDSLSMGDEHLDTIPATESDEFIKSCVDNLVLNPSESEDENGCDVLAGFTTFSNVLFDDDYDSDSSGVEDVREKIYSNPLFDEEIIPMEIDQHSFNVENSSYQEIVVRQLI